MITNFLGVKRLLFNFIVRDVLKDLWDLRYKGICVIKSTITPDHLTKMKKDFGKGVKIVYNPEFLTERNAVKDFENHTQDIRQQSKVKLTDLLSRINEEKKIEIFNPIYG